MRFPFHSRKDAGGHPRAPSTLTAVARSSNFRRAVRRPVRAVRLAGTSTGATRWAKLGNGLAPMRRLFERRMAGMDEMTVALAQQGQTASVASIRDYTIVMDRPSANGGSDAGPMGGETLLAAL